MVTMHSAPEVRAEAAFALALEHYQITNVRNIRVDELHEDHGTSTFDASCQADGGKFEARVDVRKDSPCVIVSFPSLGTWNVPSRRYEWQS